MINLATIRIASPCSADWDAMSGDERVRFCQECGKHVYNLSAMTARDAEALLVETEGRICTRFYRRPDGKILTEDCPVGLRAKAARVRRRLSFAISRALSLAAAFGQSGTAIRGMVTDPSGAIIPRTEVTIVNEKSGKSVRLLSDDMGTFVARDLEEGKYRIKASSPGFEPFIKQHIELRAKSEVVVDMSLKLGPFTMGILVEAVPPKK